MLAPCRRRGALAFKVPLIDLTSVRRSCVLQTIHGCPEVRPRSIHASKGKTAVAPSSAPSIRRVAPSEVTASAAGDPSGYGVEPRLLPFVHRLAELIVADLLRTHGKQR
jgi:hypothetical protein